MEKKSKKMLLFLLLLMVVGDFVTPTFAIVDGVSATKKDWFVLLSREYGRGQNPIDNGVNLDECERVKCGGALVAQDMVLTAAHCFKELINPEPCGCPANEFPDTAHVGRQGMCREDGDVGKAFFIEYIYPHENYQDNGSYNLNDIALLKLAEYSASNCNSPYQAPAYILGCDVGKFGDNTVLATYGETDLTVSQSGLQMYGFGRTINIDTVTSNVLKSAETTYVANDQSSECVNSQGFDSSSNFCVSPFVSCLGDSGGGLALGDDVVGIASYFPGTSYECIDGRIGDVYTNVANYKQWIFNTICAYSSFPPAGCRTAKFSEEDIGIPEKLPYHGPSSSPGTLETLKNIGVKALVTATSLRAQTWNFFWGDGFN